MPNNYNTFKEFKDAVMNKMQNKSYNTYADFKNAISDCFVQFVHDEKAPLILQIKDLGEQSEKDSEDDF